MYIPMVGYIPFILFFFPLFVANFFTMYPRCRHHLFPLAQMLRLQARASTYTHAHTHTHTHTGPALDCDKFIQDCAREYDREYDR
jgi:hypothetical protein